MKNRRESVQAHLQAERPDCQPGNPVKEMFLLAALYLPLGFFLWFSFGSALMWFPSKLAEWALTGFYPEVFDRVVQFGYQLEIQTAIRMERMVDGRVALLNNDVNPMIYAWGMALLFGLIMATPTGGRARALQLLIAYLVISVVTAWGVFWQTWSDLAFLSRTRGRDGGCAGRASADADRAVLPARLPDAAGRGAAGDLDFDEPAVSGAGRIRSSPLNRARYPRSIVASTVRRIYEYRRPVSRRCL